MQARPTLYFSRLIKLQHFAWLVALIILVAGLSLTYIVVQHIEQNYQEKLTSRLDAEAERATRNIRSLITSYTVVLQGLQGFVHGSDRIQPQEFSDYVSALKLSSKLPGIEAVALVDLVSGDQRATYVERLRQEGMEQYTIHPLGERAFYTPIRLIEPMTSRNRDALGLDISSIEAERAAIAKSRDIGEVVVSQPLNLIQDAGTEALGFVMYSPFYQTGDVPDSVETRRESIIGWVDVIFHVNAMMKGLSDELEPSLRYKIYDASTTEPTLMYESLAADAENAEAMKTSRWLNVGGRDWQIVTTTTPMFAENISGHEQAYRLTWLAVLITLLFSWLSWFLVSSRDKARHQFQRLFELADDGVLILNRDHQIIDANPAVSRLLKCQPQTLSNERLETLITDEQRVQLPQFESDVMSGKHHRGEWQFLRDDEDVLPVMVSAHKLDQQRYFMMLHDLTERYRKVARIRRLTQIYRALSETNQAIVRMTDEKELLPLACRCAVEFGGMKMAWIGTVDKSTGQIQPQCSHGAGQEYLKSLNISAYDSEPGGRGPTGTAFRQNFPVIINDYQNDVMTAAWHEQARLHGWQSAACFPVQRNKQPYAVFNVYHAEKHSFDKEVIGLLHEMALDIGFALDNFDREQQRQQSEQALKERESRYRLIFGANPMPMWVYDLDSLKFLAVNDAAVLEYGYSREQFLNMTIADIRPSTEKSALDNELERTRGAPHHAYHNAGIWQHIKANGELIWVEITGHKFRFEGKKAEIILAHNVTERVETEKQLHLHAQVFESSREGILVIDASHNVASANPAFCHITGFQDDQLIGKPPPLIKKDHQQKGFYRRLWARLEAEGHWQGEVQNSRADGSVFSQWLSISEIRDNRGNITYYTALISDLSEVKAAQERIAYLSHYDTLTQLPNMSLLRERAEYALQEASRRRSILTLLYLDIDRFKIINDSLGPRVGDEIIRLIAERLSEELGSDDTLCRQGGDEFIFLLPDMDTERAAHFALQLLDTLARPFEYESHRLNLSASIGIAQFPEDGENIEALMQAADAALFRAKQNGRNKFEFFTHQLQQQAQATLVIENDLREAIKNDELFLHYQPQVDAHTGAIIGVEALIRWQHPEHGMISPAQFIPVAEETGLINTIGNWVLDSAISQAAYWQSAGLPAIPVAVNLSASQFRHDGLYSHVTGLLQMHQLDPAMLELEITESTVMEHTRRTVEILNQFHQLGVRLAIDDFGTGYSSLSYLKRFNVDKLKIDQSFMRDLENNPDDEAIISAIISLSKSLGFRTIAEGVETEAQLAYLQARGCDEVQGFLFSKPLPADQFAILLGQGAEWQQIITPNR